MKSLTKIITITGALTLLPFGIKDQTNPQNKTYLNKSNDSYNSDSAYTVTRVNINQ
ncbi:MAG: hypothetical protein AABW51_02170 [Nanoarchaeota archaeon]